MYQRILAALTAAALLVAFLAAPLPSFAQTSTAPTAATTETKKPKREPTPGQLAARERQKKCATEWKETKAAGKVEKGMKWPQYWSACNKRLKAGT